MRLPFTLAILALLHSSSAAVAVPPDHLLPEDGPFAPSVTEAYSRFLADTLVSEHELRLCQFFALPSLGKESVVYVVDEDDPKAPALVVAKQPEQPIWGTAMNSLTLPKAGPPLPITEENLRSALPKVAVKITRWERPIDRSTLLLLAKIWTKMLSDVRYAVDYAPGTDGIDFHISHLRHGSGYLSGRAWSPPAGSLVEQFADLGEALFQFAQHQQSAERLREKADRVWRRLQKKVP